MATSLQIPDEIVISVQQTISEKFSNIWTIIPIDGLSPAAKQQAHRLNSLGSSYYFGKITLHKDRFREYLHREWCEIIEQDLIKDVIEIPRDHFKSTIFSEVGPMWWALPFTQDDEDLMRILGYDDRWVKWMKRAHDQDTRTLIVSENIKNACKLGKRINRQYQNNKFFINLFPEIQPDSSCEWSVETKTQKRSQKSSSYQGEGTFDFLGVDGALQSRHYNRVVQDDLVGKKSLTSFLEMESTIDYHKLLIGAFDSDPTKPDNDNDEIVVGNRWSYKDLNYYIRKNEPRFRITNHSALGGCCTKHPIGQPIFPDEFGPKKLQNWRERLGAYFFSCQFLNSPTPPGENKFKEQWLRTFRFKTDLSLITKKPIIKGDHGYNYIKDWSSTFAHQNEVLPPTSESIGNETSHAVMIEHMVKDGESFPDIYPGNLKRTMICDPNHAGDEGRSRNAICVTGVNHNSWIYLLECYAEFSGQLEFVNTIFKLAEKWKMRQVHLEVVGAQRWLKFHIDSEMSARRNMGKWTFEVVPLDLDNSKNAKIQRIEALENVFGKGTFNIPAYGANGADKFLAEYSDYPFVATRDILDVLGYGQQFWDIEYLTEKDAMAMFRQGRERFAARTKSLTGY